MLLHIGITLHERAVVLLLCRQQVESRLLAEKASLAAATKEQRAELAAELEALQARSLAAVVAKKEAVKQQQASGASKLQQHKAAKQAVVSSAR
jgi:hypothetical protein